MKHSIQLVAGLLILFSASQVSAQNHQEKQIQKEVHLEDENGVKTLTIKTITDGTVNTEVYTGAEADAKIAEFEQEKSSTTKTMFVGEDGKQHLKVETRVVVKEEIDPNEE